MAYIERIIDTATGETIERPYTKVELDELEANQKKAAERGAERDAELAIKATEKAALLTKLGITADEAALLLS